MNTIRDIEIEYKKNYRSYNEKEKTLPEYIITLFATLRVGKYDINESNNDQLMELLKDAINDYVFEHIKGSFNDK